MAPNGNGNGQSTRTATATTIKRYQDELDLLNRRGKPKPTHTIDSASTFTDLGNNISREDMFKLIKELYGFSKRTLDHLSKQTDAGTIAQPFGRPYKISTVRNPPGYDSRSSDET